MLVKGATGARASSASTLIQLVLICYDGNLLMWLEGESQLLSSANHIRNNSVMAWSALFKLITIDIHCLPSGTKFSVYCQYMYFSSVCENWPCNNEPLLYYAPIVLTSLSWMPVSPKVYELLSQIFKNQFYSHLKSCNLIRPQFCTCHDSTAVITCAKLWPYLININKL